MKVPAAEGADTGGGGAFAGIGAAVVAAGGAGGGGAEDGSEARAESSAALGWKSLKAAMSDSSETMMQSS